jgi:hypothetical protein
MIIDVSSLCVARAIYVCFCPLLSAIQSPHQLLNSASPPEQSAGVIPESYITCRPTSLLSNKTNTSLARVYQVKLDISSSIRYVNRCQHR